MSRIGHRHFPVIARSEATKQSIHPLCREVDCFAEHVIGQRFALTRWLAMTACPYLRTRKNSFSSVAASVSPTAE